MKYDLTVPDAENGYEYRDFNPFVACLSPGQRAILEIGVDQVVMSALATGDTIESAVNLSAYAPDLSDDPETDEALAGTELEAYINEVDDKMAENLANVIISMEEKEDSGGAISVFNGVNRVVFHSDNVALTSKSLREKNAEELMNFAKVENDSVQDKKDKLMYAMIGLGAGAVVTGGA